MNYKAKLHKNNAQRFSLDAIASSFLAILFSFFFIFVQASELASPRGENCEASNQSTSRDNAHIIADHSPLLQFPINSIPVPPESESEDEREFCDPSDGDDGKLQASLLLKDLSNLTSRKSVLLQLMHADKNRKAVSLFVLHHSWKSFLS